jgi:membrane dipeptidase
VELSARTRAVALSCGLLLAPAVSSQVASKPAASGEARAASAAPAASTPSAASTSSDTALSHARSLLQGIALVDGHNDLPWTIREEAAGDPATYDLRARRDKGDTDLPRLREGLVSGQFWSVWIPSGLERPARTQLEQIELARRMFALHADTLLFATRAADVERARSEGKIASFLGMENGQALENSLGALRAYYDLGVRYMTLTHGRNNDWADSATDTPVHGGLTPFGREVVREMNRLGMLVDLSHVSPEVMRQALDVSEAPVVFSHSSARALVDHRRNVPDDVLARMAKNGGVVMVTFIPPFVSAENAAWGKELESKAMGIQSSAEMEALLAAHEKLRGPAPHATLAQVADHIEHVARVAGKDHVGIGSDFWGTPPMPDGLEDVSRFPYLFAELIRRGWSDADLAKLAGGNIVRTLATAETVAARLQKERPASTATIEALDGKK